MWQHVTLELWSTSVCEAQAVARPQLPVSRQEHLAHGGDCGQACHFP